MRSSRLLLLLAWATPLAAQAAPPALDRATIDSVERLVRNKMARDQVPGLSIAIVVRGQLAWSAGFGLADRENGVAATATTVYRTASIGKAITATAAMQLVEQRRLDLDDPVQRYCPTFPAKPWPITTRHLLGHTSGIRHYGGPRNEQELFNTTRYTDVIAPLAIFAHDSLLFEPGTRYLYSTFGYNLLGCVVQGAAARSYLAFVQESIFAPAGMSDTRADDVTVRVARRARGYVRTDSGIVPSRFADMSSKLPAGGFVTTAEDLARFAAALVTHRLTSAATFEQILTPVRLASGEVVGYGFGWGLAPGETWYGQREAFHGGSTPEVSGMLYLLPDAQFAVAFLMNLEQVTGRTELAAQIAKVVLRLGPESSRSGM